MLVGNKNGVELLWRHAGGTQPRQQMPESKAAIHQQSGWLVTCCFNHCCIACAAAPQTSKPDHVGRFIWFASHRPWQLRQFEQRPGRFAGRKPRLFKVVNKDLNNALRIGRWLWLALRIEY